MLSCEVALYPQDTAKSDEIIKAALNELEAMGVPCQVGPVSTFFAGDPEVVWNGLRALYTAAAAQGQEVAMVATVTNSVP
ncbi:MAG: YkoF family thiamine/hydroxymethylpyrimidine-binding protein [Bacillota bacterium]|nr:YkoF family thiamine/hydroxymethylpyrimidine-binding protein [Bacillota bacterium]